MEDLVLEFAKSYPDHPEVSLPIPTFTFVQAGRHLDGIQIEVPPYETIIQNTWDLAIYFNSEEKMSKVRASLSDVWSKEGKQAVGNDKDYQIALYVDRNCCKKSHAASVLELQVDRLKLYSLNPHDGQVSHPEASYIDQIRLEEGMISKSWTSSKNNIRRAVGLYLWDQINDPHSGMASKKSVIKTCIDFLGKSNPSALEAYVSYFNTPSSDDNSQKIGDLGTTFQSVVREMEVDYDLAALCIEKADYRSPQEVRRKSQPD